MTKNELAPDGHEEPKKKSEQDKPYTPGWDAMEDHVADQICLVHQIQKQPHNPALHTMQMLSVITGLLVGITFHKEHGFEAEVLMAEYEVKLKAAVSHDTILDPGDPTGILNSAKAIAQAIKDAHDRIG